MPGKLILIFELLIGLLPAQSEEFAGDVFGLENSIINNGNASAFSSPFYSPSRFLQFPGDGSDAPAFAIEAATLPLFGGLSQALNGAGTLRLDSNLRLSAFTSIVSTSNIMVLPLLRGTYAERLADPDLRPDGCQGCPSLRDRVYLGSLNIHRTFSTQLPRVGLESRPIPVQLGTGISAKYFWEELEGGDYQAQNLNADAGLSLRVLWDYNPIDKVAYQVFKIQIGGFELLPTRQRSDIGQFSAFESLNHRWHYSGSFEQVVTSLHSTFVLGVEQRSEGGRWPALGAEWLLDKALALRGGWDENFWAAGVSARYRWISVHYALRHHDLGTSYYQVSLQLQPW